MAASVILFWINLFSLINGETVYYITIELTVKLNDMEKVNKTWFVHCNMNQKYAFFFF